jgi:hypothetical protein
MDNGYFSSTIKRQVIYKSAAVFRNKKIALPEVK